MQWSLVGPSDATIDGAGHITWTPTRPGRYRLVALAVDQRGAGARVFDVAVGEPSAAAPEGDGGCGCRTRPASAAGGATLLAFALASAMLRRHR